LPVHNGDGDGQGPRLIGLKLGEAQVMKPEEDGKAQDEKEGQPAPAPLECYHEMLHLSGLGLRVRVRAASFDAPPEQPTARIVPLLAVCFQTSSGQRDRLAAVQNDFIVNAG